MTQKVRVINGDDAAPGAVRPTVELLQSMELDLEFLRPLTGEEAIALHGTGFPEEARQAIEVADTTPSPPCSQMSMTATLAPSRANSRAVALPMPLLGLGPATVGMGVV